MTVALVANIARPISSAISTAFAMDNYGKLNYYGKLGAWSPLSLFAASEVGAWYDPSDLSTMFQDSSGTTPVTADGQPVGLILDKSKGLVLGPELVTNGDFSNGTTGWTEASGTISSVDGKLRVEVTGVGSAALYTFPVVVGKTYRFQFSQENGTGVARMMVGSSYPTQNYVAIVDGNKTNYTCVFVPTVPTAVIQAQCNTAVAGQYSLFDNISVKEITGNHAVAPSDAARPLKTSTTAADWINYDAVDDVLNTTFPSSLGSSCTVCRANVGAAPTILTAQTIGTSYADSTDNAGLIIINRALTDQETTDVTAWLTAKGAT